MKIRLKKVMVKVRKEQETEMKQTFMKEKCRVKEAPCLTHFALPISRQMEERIFALQNLLASRDAGSSHSDCSST